MAIVKGIVEDGDSWWYVACKCGRVVRPDSGMYYCDVCFSHVFNVSPRYRVKIEVEDATVTAVLVLFDCDGQLLFKRSCAEMITEAKRGGGVANYPSVFSILWWGRSSYSKLRPSLFQQANLMEHARSNVSVMMTPLLPCFNFLGLRLLLQRPCLIHHSLRFTTWAVMNLKMIQLLLRIFPPKCLMNLFVLDLLNLLLMLRLHLQRENLKKL